MSAHASSTPDRDPPPKAVLFCPECGHESATTGDWIVRESEEPSDERASGAAYECPDCETVITTRSRAELPQYA
ncbi:phage terminase large subunit family protein [Halosimplex aquaticum]|uniref:Phage terminase large subunit family protein n=1 Tax=Halosimplex aquaticum TaxID=3026162 RepID=A0ABD5XZ82_9EURY|nr:phage terminase large subunit family protein [Halosimplex aquaticum]